MYNPNTLPDTDTLRALMDELYINEGLPPDCEIAKELMRLYAHCRLRDKVQQRLQEATRHQTHHVR